MAVTPISSGVQGNLMLRRPIHTSRARPVVNRFAPRPRASKAVLILAALHHRLRRPRSTRVGDTMMAMSALLANVARRLVHNGTMRPFASKPAMVMILSISKKSRDGGLLAQINGKSYDIQHHENPAIKQGVVVETGGGNDGVSIGYGAVGKRLSMPARVTIRFTPGRARRMCSAGRVLT